MQGISFKLFTCHVRHDCSWKSHETCSLILSSITPTISLLATSRSIACRLFGYKMLRLIDCGIGQNKLTLYSWASSTLDTRIMVIVGRVVIGRLNWAIALLLSRSAIAREASSIPQRNIVRSSASLLSPRHDVVPGIKYRWLPISILL